MGKLGICLKWFSDANPNRAKYIGSKVYPNSFTIPAIIKLSSINTDFFQN
jgi:hypothetical protein